jgi:hypothetical protein
LLEWLPRDAPADTVNKQIFKPCVAFLAKILNRHIYSIEAFAEQMLIAVFKKL